MKFNFYLAITSAFFLGLHVGALSGERELLLMPSHPAISILIDVVMTIGIVHVFFYELRTKRSWSKK